MGRYTAPAAVGLIVVAALVYATIRLSSVAESQRLGSPAPGEPEKHLVTPAMAEASRGMVMREAADFRGVANDGREYALRDLLRQGPVVLTFIKIGCPCSQAAQPYFNQVAAAYPSVRVLGVIDGELGPAQLWIRQLRTAYPVLLDPDLKLVRLFGVENSAYVIVVDRYGRIAMHWPGYSASMLQQLGAALASMTGTPFRPIDTLDAPADLYTGCPYAL